MKIPGPAIALMLVIAANVVVGDPAEADSILYGLADLSTSQPNGVGQQALVTIDPASGKATVVGGIDPGTYARGLVFHGGVLYTYDIAANVLATIDPNSGHVTSAVSLGLPRNTAEEQIAFGTDGTGYLVTYDGKFYRLDLAHASAALISASLPTNIGGAAFGPNGALYAYTVGDGRFFTIDPSTGATTTVGAFPPPRMLDGGLAFLPGGSFYAELSDALYTINPSTGSSSLVGSSYSPLIPGIAGLAFAPVPEPRSAALIASGASSGLLAFGIAARRRMARRVGPIMRRADSASRRPCR